MKRLLSNPVLQEGIQVYFIEGRGFVVYAVYLALVALLQGLVLFLPAGDPRIWMGPAYLFKVTAVGVLVLLLYFIVRSANQEFASWRFRSLTRWFKEERLGAGAVAAGQIAVLVLQASVFLVLALPLLAWAGAIEGTPLSSMVATGALLFFYALVYGGWGLFAVVFWDHSQDSRRVFVRCFLVCLLLVSGLLYLALNPVAFLLRELEGLELLPLSVGHWTLEGATVHGVFHGLLFIGGFGLYGWALKRVRETYS